MWQYYRGEPLSLCAHDVHVWRVLLTHSEQFSQDHERCLSADEIARADQFIQKKDRIQFIKTRCALRFTLSLYLNIQPEKIVFARGGHGKPWIADSDLTFNMSHSGRYLLMGVTRHRAIGVDIECAKDNRDFLALAKRFFSPSEYLSIQSATHPAAAFYRCWTRKEAFVKATGLGLSFPLSHFEVDVAETPDGASCLLRVAHPGFLAAHWTLRSIFLETGQPAYFAAIAVQGEVDKIYFFNQ
jgi:4'-phosphopantetheinyl transferase